MGIKAINFPVCELNQLSLSVLALSSFGLVGCQTWGDLYQIPTGSRLVLQQSLTVPPYRNKVYFQSGYWGYGANQYYPFCRLELRQPQPGNQIINPDTFLVMDVRREADLFASINSHARFAGLISPGEGSPSPIIYAIHLQLQSTAQPEVVRLSCGHLQDPTIEARYLNLDQIRHALGDLITLEIEGSAPS